ncbi:collagenase [Streptosporangium sp. NPDC006007]|uniref:collagenase n=1 Tax=Streptosporangium sp. NPDC006007 TaxID=3154575 RepID=UPI0033BD0472
MQSRLRRTISQVVLIGSVLGLGVGTQVVLASPGSAVARDTSTITSGTVPDGDVIGPSDGAPPHIQHEPLKLEDRPPLSASTKERGRDHNAPPTTDKPTQKATEKPTQKSLQAAAACGVSDFTGRTGGALVTAIKNATPDCVNTLFGLTGGNASAAFRESQMTSVAYALRDNALYYTGDNSTGTLQLVLYLRAGYYVQWYHPGDVGSYGAGLKTAIRSALDAFYANGHSGDVNNVNGETLAEAVTLIDSARENARYIYVVKRLLNAYNSSYDQHWYMLNAVNGVYTVLFNGHDEPEFVTAVTNDTSVLDTLNSFANNKFNLISTGNYYLPYNAARELSRFLRHSALKAKVRPLTKALIGRSGITGTTARIWVGAGEMTDRYDKANCSYFGTCDFLGRVKAVALPLSHTCSPTLRILAQDMTAAQFSESCASLANQDAFFHNIVKDNGPVADDNNTSLEVSVFDSDVDYDTYAGALYGIDTNNGGMYLEGNPAVAGNQPRFIAYEADWLRPTFAIWNLNHEYTHYLDGRYNMHGDFDAGITTPTIWWIEGFAEYVSYSYRQEVYTAAITEAAKKTFTLRELFDTTYDHNDTTRTYRWGYLAVRYMLEKHPADVTKVLGYYRSGNWNAARTFLTGLNYNTDWNAWLTACATGACGGGGGNPNNQAPTAAFTSSVNGATATFTDGSTDSDGTIASRMWDFGDGTTSTAATPSKTYTASGTYAVRLTVTDNDGGTGTVTKSVTVTVALPQCTSADSRELGKNCARSNATATAGNYSYFYINVPAGTTQLKITSSGGTGNADLYYSPSTWATTGNYTKRSVTAGNAETLTITNPAAGYHFITLHGATAFGGVTVTSQY